jgi:hypothetical protein
MYMQFRVQSSQSHSVRQKPNSVRSGLIVGRCLIIRFLFRDERGKCAPRCGLQTLMATDCMTPARSCAAWWKGPAGTVWCVDACDQAQPSPPNSDHAW